MAIATARPGAVRVEELARRLEGDAGVRLVDVRSPVEFESSHIPGSVNVPLEQVSGRAADIRDGVSGELVLVCRSGQRARQAEAFLREADVSAVQVLEGGLMAWERAGLPVDKGTQRWSLERQVRAIAGALVLIGTLGSLFVWSPLLYLAMFVGGGLLFAGLTDTCMMGMMLLRLPYNRGPEFDADAAIAKLRAH